MQDLLESHMGMVLPDMQAWSQKPPEERNKQQLPSAHLPERGFYLIKSSQARQAVPATPLRWTKMKNLLQPWRLLHQGLPVSEVGVQTCDQAAALEPMQQHAAESVLRHNPSLNGNEAGQAQLLDGHEQNDDSV